MILLICVAAIVFLIVVIIQDQFNLSFQVSLWLQERLLARWVVVAVVGSSIANSVVDCVMGDPITEGLIQGGRLDGERRLDGEGLHFVIRGDAPH